MPNVDFWNILQMKEKFMVLDSNIFLTSVAESFWF